MTPRLLARVRSAVRRLGVADPPKLVETPEFTIDFEAKVVTRDGAPVRLTPTEWRLVEVLARNAGRLVSGSSCCTRSGVRRTPAISVLRLSSRWLQKLRHRLIHWSSSSSGGGARE